MNSKATWLGVSLSVSVMALSACSNTDTAQTNTNAEGDEYQLVNMRTEKDVRNVNAAQSGYHSVKVTDSEAAQETEVSSRDPAPAPTPTSTSSDTEVSEVLPVEKTVQFEFDSAKLTPLAKTELLNLLDAAEDAEGVPVHAAVDGYTDATGPSDYNRDLSERRAQSVVKYLESQGAEVVKWQVQGHGEASPIADNSNAAGREQNRRVEVNLLSSQEREQLSAR
ncbi:OmpA family protein [Gilvimarinus chinensis]|uniref:OmpA family protein n=1 Tax=Gilvimarinus chinensis TaxID=396005 RepID=UPI00036700B7|nr:OmpA family protein [Gilvimarinus chinensis]